MLPDRPNAASRTPRIRPTHIWTVNSVRRTAWKVMTSSCVRPAADKVVIQARQGDEFFTVADLGAQALNGVVEFEQHFARGLVADHALNPEKRSPAAAACHRRDMVTA